MPRELLPDFYQWIGSAFPATYAVQGLMNLLFGGTGVGKDCLALILIMVFALIVIAIATSLRKDKMPVSPLVAVAES